MISLERRDLAMTIGAWGRTASIGNLLSRCERFGLTVDAARVTIDAVVATVRTWRDHFRDCGVAPEDIERMASAFLPECFFVERAPGA
jgi:serine/threonine-protein kinase HipA